MLDGWLASPVVWIPPATDRTGAVLRGLMLEAGVAGVRTTDAQLAAMAIEFGVPVVSADADFARFPGVIWINPLAN
ncbi:PIN domain-containing protein [Luteococcus sp. H138]|uniref:PIN domain-containing protein n=1 Tax=unclassified Luteococcus TaxID=2639923 RepID=UPI00313BF433